MENKENKRKICVIVTNRSEYSRFKSIIKVLSKEERVILQTVAVKTPYSDSKSLFDRDGIKLDEVIDIKINSRELKEVSKTVGELVKEFSEVFDRLKPNMVLIHGDRYEAISATLAATFQNIFIVHIQGGEVTGTTDEHIRHSITKLAQLHLPSTEESANRIIKLGEVENSVFSVGCPGVDTLLSTESIPFSELRYELYRCANNRTEVLEKFKPGYFLVMQSPVVTEMIDAEKQISETLSAISNFEQLKIILLPNPDAGSDKLQNIILDFASNNKDILIFKHFPPEVFTNLLRQSAVLIGNSSAGIRESCYFGIPTVNIGSRQNGRERTRNVVDVKNDRNVIKDAIDQALIHGKYIEEKLFGNGDTANKIREILLTVDYKNIQKKITY